MSKLSLWIKALRLRTLPLALACVSMGSILAFEDDLFRWDVFVLSLLTTLFLQLLSNVANDYGDAVSGVDGLNRVGPSRMVQAGLISQKEMFRAVLLFSILSFASGMLLLYTAIGIQFTTFFFVLLGVLSIAAAITYTMGRRPYGYAGLGDLSVFIFFGLVGVVGTYFLHGQTFRLEIILPAASCSFFAVAVLNINNIRDIESDRENGKFSIPVKIGRSNAILYHYALLLVGFASMLIYVILNYQGPWQLLFLLVLPLLIKNARSVSKYSTSVKLDPFLKQMALTTLLFVLSYGIGTYVQSYF